MVIVKLVIYNVIHQIHLNICICALQNFRRRRISQKLLTSVFICREFPWIASFQMSTYVFLSNCHVNLKQAFISIYKICISQVYLYLVLSKLMWCFQQVMHSCIKGVVVSSWKKKHKTCQIGLLSGHGMLSRVWLQEVNCVIRWGLSWLVPILP